MRALPTVDFLLQPLNPGADALAVISRSSAAETIQLVLQRSLTGAFDPGAVGTFVTNLEPLDLGAVTGVEVVAFDEEGDGVDELLVTSDSPTVDEVVVRMFQLPTNFELEAVDSFSPVSLGRSVASGRAGDFDLDGVRSTLLLAARTGDAPARLVQPTAAFPGGLTSTGLWSTPFGSLAGALEVAYARLDGGDLLDLAVLFDDGTVDVGLGTGAEAIETLVGRRSALLGGGIVALAVGDLDGDGRDEVVGVRDAGGVQLVVAPSAD